MHKKIFYFLIISIFFLTSCFNIAQNTDIKNNSLIVKPKLPVSSTGGTISLSYDENHAVYGDAHNNIKWNFTGSKPYIGIKCLLMDDTNYDLFIQGGPYSYSTLSSGTLSADSGLVNIGTDTTWYVVFTNEDPDHETTELTYIVEFDADIDNDKDKDAESFSNDYFIINNIYTIYYIIGILFLVNIIIGLIFFLPNFIKNIKKKLHKKERIVE